MVSIEILPHQPYTWQSWGGAPLPKHCIITRIHGNSLLSKCSTPSSFWRAENTNGVTRELA